MRGGGGVAVDPLARVRVVGSTDQAGFPNVTGRAYGADTDGLHVEFDMLPLGVQRTDATVPAPAGTITGGTTPACLLAPLGVQIGAPAPQLQRMLIDVDWDPATRNATLLLDRPPVNTTGLAGGILQLGPLSPPTVIDLVELWVTTNEQVIVLVASPNQSLAFNLGTIPIGVEFSAQFVPLITPLTCAGVTTPLTMTGSPALNLLLP